MPLDSLAAIALRYSGVLPANATVISPPKTNATDITSTTPVTIAAAPGSGLTYYITRITAANATPAEAPVLTVQDNSGTPVVLDSFALSTAAGNGGTESRVYDPPIKVGDNKAIAGKSDGATGDTKVTVQGFVGAV